MKFELAMSEDVGAVLHLHNVDLEYDAASLAALRVLLTMEARNVAVHWGDGDITVELRG